MRWLESLKIWGKSFKLTFVDLKWRQIQQLHGLFLSSDVFRNTFRWTILVQYEIRFWTSSSNQLPVFIFGATIQISAACCYGDVLGLVSSVCSEEHFGPTRGDWSVTLALLPRVRIVNNNFSLKNGQKMLFSASQIWRTLALSCVILYYTEYLLGFG